jgi:hypothetical protein
VCICIKARKVVDSLIVQSGGLNVYGQIVGLLPLLAISSLVSRLPLVVVVSVL